MLDPVSALGLAASVVQLVQFGSGLVIKARSIVKSGKDSDLDVVSTLTREFEKIHDQFIVTLDRFERNSGITFQAAPTMSVVSTDALAAVRALSAEAYATAKKLEALLGYLKVQPELRRSRRQALVQAVRTDKRPSDHTSDLSQALQHVALESTTSHDTIINCIETLQGICRFDHTALNHTELVRLSTSLDAVSRQRWFKVITTCNNILSSLTFEERTWRQEAILEAHSRTFDWIFNSPDSGFRAWMQSAGNVFWIAGKAGSGKSTLMKYLSEHPRTSELLGAWSGHKRVILASHYFWYAGTRMQKTQLGLLRSILLQIVRQSPALAYTVVPQRFIKESHGEEYFPWTRQELTATLRAIAEHKDLSIRFCFFIDGLDEYDGDHSDIVEVISTLAKSPYIKICVSSRPWNVFTGAYGKDGKCKLLLQDLTKSDIEKYVSDTLMADRRFVRLHGPGELCRPLMLDIMRRAQGVFLWVFLVVRSLLRGLTDNNDVPTLMARLDHFPQDLDGFFEHMLESIDPVYQHHTARIFLAALQTEFRLPVSVPWHLGRELADPEYAMKAPIQKLTEIDELEIRNVTVYLNARCMDLLEIDNVKLQTIVFLHRTAKDYLEQDHVLAKIRRRAGASYDVRLSLAKVCLAEMKLQPSLPRFADLLSGLLQYGRLMNSTGTAAYLRLISELDQKGDRFVSDFGPERHQHWTAALTFVGSTYTFPNFLAFAVAVDLVSYVRATLRQHPAAMRSSHGKTLLEYALRPHKNLGGHELMLGDIITSDGIDPDMISLLLQHGANPNAYLYNESRLTLWEWFLSNSHDPLRQDSDPHIRTAKLMIQHGADLKRLCCSAAFNVASSKMLGSAQSSMRDALNAFMGTCPPTKVTAWNLLQSLLSDATLEELQLSIPQSKAWWAWWYAGARTVT
ncbi:hypothetical protein LTR78_008087 [Recurvomyces mirabilis]|uniref:NACHT domain-containing protein n=1 Tax=Recurvomyces mirabilis TaxID=574656 RepID=A0AAE0TS79_9PEZI|nr:hypothetical protein LTR78_008087 [Recurvomyces mirabilis]KAK5150814.1 hypothetical protein LTS14_009878 [Recurvomyces mirabilis]